MGNRRVDIPPQVEELGADWVQAWKTAVAKGQQSMQRIILMFANSTEERRDTLALIFEQELRRREAEESEVRHG